MVVVNECSRCGRCCKIIPIAHTRGIDPGLKHYLITHGCLEEHGNILVPIKCPHLSGPVLNKEIVEEYTCDIHLTKPQTCKDFDGRPLSHGRKYFIPDGCTMSRKGGKK